MRAALEWLNITIAKDPVDESCAPPSAVDFSAPPLCAPTYSPPIFLPSLSLRGELQ